MTGARAQAKALIAAGWVEPEEQAELEELLNVDAIECHGCGELMSESHARYMQDDGCQDAPVCCDCAAEYRRRGRIIR